MAEDEQIVTEEDKVAEDDLKKTKEKSETKEPVDAEEQVERSEVEDESEEKQEAEESEEESKDESEEQPTLAKKFPNLKGEDWETYAKSLETAYDNSFKEVRRLKEQSPPVEKTDEAVHPAVAYAQRQMEDEAQKAFDGIKDKYPQIQDLDTFEKFRKAVEGVSNAIWSAESRQPTFSEAYEKAAMVLGWGSDEAADKLGAAAKGVAASGKTNSATKPAPKSKITDKEVALARQTWASTTMSDTEIRKELETYKA